MFLKRNELLTLFIYWILSLHSFFSPLWYPSSSHSIHPFSFPALFPSYSSRPSLALIPTAHLILAADALACVIAHALFQETLAVLLLTLRVLATATLLALALFRLLTSPQLVVRFHVRAIQALTPQWVTCQTALQAVTIPLSTIVLWTTAFDFTIESGLGKRRQVFGFEEWDGAEGGGVLVFDEFVGLRVREKIPLKGALFLQKAIIDFLLALSPRFLKHLLIFLTGLTLTGLRLTGFLQSISHKGKLLGEFDLFVELLERVQTLNFVDLNTQRGPQSVDAPHVILLFNQMTWFCLIQCLLLNLSFLHSFVCISHPWQLTYFFIDYYLGL